jgi:hypothetical protein
MSRIRLLPLIAAATLAATAVSAHAQYAQYAQYVKGGMGEEVKIGADFGGESAHPIGSRRLLDSNGLVAAGRDKGRARAKNQYEAHGGSQHGKIPLLPGKNLP